SPCIRFKSPPMPLDGLRPPFVGGDLNDEGLLARRDNQGVGDEVDRRIVADDHLAASAQNGVNAGRFRLIESKPPATTDPALRQFDEVNLKGLHQAVEIATRNSRNRAIDCAANQIQMAQPAFTFVRYRGQRHVFTPDSLWSLPTSKGPAALRRMRL